MSSRVHMPLGRTAVRPRWHQLPADLRRILTDRLGEVTAADAQRGGFTPGVAARLSTTGAGRVFIKAIAESHVLAAKYGYEARAAAALPAQVPAPRLIWHDTLCGWVVLVFEDVAGRHPDLSPGSPDVTATVETVAGLSKALTPNPLPGAPSAPGCRDWLHGWTELKDTPDLGGWERRNLEQLAEAETRWLPHSSGPSLLHGDIRPDNLLVREKEGAVVVVDWAQPYQGASWHDTADLVPHLIMAGHSPEDAENVLAGVPTWENVPDDTATAYAIAYAGYWARMSRQPAPPGVPHLRPYQVRAAETAVAWVRYRTGWR